MPFGKVPRKFTLGDECRKAGYAKKFEQKVKKVIRKTAKIELKHEINEFPVTLPFRDQTLNIASVVRQMFPLDRGNDVNQRNGNRVMYKALSWRYSLKNIDNGTQGEPGVARVMIVMDKKSNKTSLADNPENLNLSRALPPLRNFTHANIRNTEYMSRYTVLHDKTHVLGGKKNNENNEKTAVVTTGYKKLNFNVQFADGSVLGTTDQMVTGPIYLILWYDTNVINLPPLQFGANIDLVAKLSYTDA